MTETERKFLVSGDSYQDAAVSHSHIRQGYICRESGRTVRVRSRDDRGYLTIKGPSRDGGLSRYEFETVITAEEAAELFRLCQPGIVEKERWIVPGSDGHTWEVDQFLGTLDGLVVAEIELTKATEPFTRPDFIAEEVTGQRQYYNSFLAALVAKKESEE